MSESISLRRHDPNCGYEQRCSCATWVPGEGWVSDLTLMFRKLKREKRERRSRR
jgi:hypothetical protein